MKCSKVSVLLVGKGSNGVINHISVRGLEDISTYRKVYFGEVKDNEPYLIHKGFFIQNEFIVIVLAERNLVGKWYYPAKNVELNIKESDCTVLKATEIHVLWPRRRDEGKFHFADGVKTRIIPVGINKNQVVLYFDDNDVKRRVE